VGVLSRRVQTAAMLVGMAAGAVALVILWWTAAVAWTWYAFIGAAVTAGVAVATGTAKPRA